MSISFRRIFFISLGAIFAIVATILILYATGLRYNFQEKKVERVGGVVIDTDPNGAEVLIDNEPVADKTPATIHSLLPGKVTIRLEKEGFFSWELPITIISSNTVRVPTIYLLKDAIPTEPFISERYSMIAPSQDTGLLAAFRDRTLSIISLSTGEELFNATANDVVSSVTWSPHSHELLYSLRNGNTYWLDASVTPMSAELIDELFDDSFTWTAWSKEEKNILYATSSGGLFRLNTFQGTKTLLSELSGIIGVSNHHIISSNPDSLSIYTASAELLDTATINLGPNVKVFDTISNYIPVLDIENESLYLFNLSSNKIERISDSVRGIIWDSALKHNLYFNSNEVVDWDARELTKDIIVRSSETISSAYWVKNQQNVIYIQDSSLYITEVRGPERNTYSIPLEGVTFISPLSDDAFIALAGGNIYKLEF